MTSTTKRAKCLSGSHSSTDGGRRYPVARSIVRKLLTSAHPETKKGRINVSILPDAAQCAKSDRLLGPKRLEGLHELLPAATNLAVLVNPNGANAEARSRAMQAAARILWTGAASPKC